MERKTVGTLMKENRRDGMKTAAVAMAVILYAGVLIFTAVHNYNLFTQGLKPDEQIFGIFALLCLEGAAIFLPIAIHFWLAPGPQRMVGYILYGIEFTIIIGNTLIDAMRNSGNVAPDWLSMYGSLISPITPITIGVGIALLFLLDPAKKIHDAAMAAKAASIDAMALEMRAAADSDEVNEHVRQQAQEHTRVAVGMAPSALQLPAPKPRPTAVTVLNAEKPYSITASKAAPVTDWSMQLLDLPLEQREDLIERLQRYKAGNGTGEDKADLKGK